ncbi:M16 family metallopeptidase [Schlesneria sp. DSM 10557]|uniref:M16 family metallopeptidase n=1 Tax=Schlesneria sp. DSM 10557 TaxID=3044399 RepID=UPI0035A1B129
MLIRWIVAGLALCCLGMNLVAAAEPRKIGSVEGLTEYQLDNGLRVVIFPEPSNDKITVNMTVLVGSRHEGYGEAGMAHLLEHMLFKPTSKHPRPDQDLQSRGADYNGTTWFDRTNYYETLPAGDDNLEWAIEYEADRLINCPINAADLTSEMTVVRNEFEMGENSPKSILEQRVFASAFEWHNYGKSTIGNRADIERVPVDNLRAFYKKYYRPDNVILFIGGRLDEAKTLELVQKHFGPIERPAEPIRATYTEEPAQDGERLVTLRRVGNVAVVGVAYHIPAAADAEFPAVALLEAILTADKTGRLYKALVERRRAAKVQGMAYALHDPGAIFISAEVAQGNEPDSVAEDMLEAINEVVKDGITEVELVRAKRQFRKYLDQLAAETPKLLIELAESAAAGDWRLFFLNRDRLEDVTVDDVNRVARKYLVPNNRTVGMYIPSQQPQRTPIAAVPDVRKLVENYKGRSDFSTGEAFDPSPAAIEARVKRSQIEGVKVALLSKKNRGGTVSLQLRLRYGSAKSLFGKAPVCDVLPSLMARATRHLNSEQLADKLDELQSTLHASGGPGEAAFVIQSKREHLSEVIDVLRQILREPAFPQDELDILKQRRAAELEEQMTQPQALAPRAVSQKLNSYPVGDVRYQPNLSDELKQIQGLELASLKKLYEDFLSAQAGELAIVGDFDEAETVAALQNALKDWKSKSPYERISRSAENPPKPETIRIETPDKANAMYFAGLLLALRDDHPDYPALVVGNEILGGSGFASRLMGRIREKEGLSYGVGSSFRSNSLDPRSTFSIYAICNPENVEKVVALAKEEIEILLKEGLKEEELAESQQGWIKGQEADRGEDGKLASILANALFVGRTLEYQAKLESRVSQLTADAVVAALRRHVNPEQLVNAIAGDFPEKPANESKQK